MNNEKPVKKKTILSSDYIWTFTTYFAEGFPYIMIRTVSSALFRDMKVALENIGLVNLFGIPWVLKFLWGPWVDEFSTKRRWLLAMQTVLVGVLGAAAFVIPLANSVQLIAALFFVGAFIAATHDIAIDGYYMEALDKDGQAKFVGYRTMAYRIAMTTGTMGVITLSAITGWFLAFLFAAALFTLFYIYHVFYLREVETPKRPIKQLFLRVLRFKPLVFAAVLILVVLGVRYFFNSSFYAGLKESYPFLKEIGFAHWVALLLLFILVLVGVLRKRIKAFILKDPESHYAKAFVYFMERDRVAVILAFIIMLRLGEWTISTMTVPFMLDLGIKIHFGWLSTFVALPASIGGAMLGGWMISRFTLKKVMWPFILLQNMTNLIYMALAIHVLDFVKINTGAENPVGIGLFNLVLVAATHGFDQFAGGLGTAVLMTYLMRICHLEYKAAHYAIGTALMNISAIFAGVAGGMIAGWLGYAWLFGLSFVFSIPAMLLIPFLPYVSQSANHDRLL